MVQTLSMLTNYVTAIKKPFYQASSHWVRKHPKKSIIIAADPRAGSTWLSEIILTQSNAALIWEPLHIGENALFKDIGFGYRQYIPEEHQWPEAKEAFLKVFAGRNLNAWTAKFTAIHKVMMAERLLIKLCRASLLLPWLVRNFEFERKPLFMVRHPFSVVCSQIKSGGWDKVPNAYKIEPTTHNQLFERHADFLSTIKTREEALLCTWCITNGYMLAHPGNNIDWVTLTYEELLLEPEKELFRVYCDHWAVDLPNEVLEKVSKPSRTSLNQDILFNKNQQLKRWENFFSREQINKFINILEYFDIQLYNESYLPTKSAGSL